MDIEEISLELSLPKVPKYCVCIFMNGDSTIYIGTTQKGIRGIFSNKHFSDNINKVLLIEAKNEIHMLEIQNDMIVKYRPPDNTCLNNLAHKVSTLKHDFELIYYFNKRAINKLIDDSGVDIIHLGSIEYLDDENYDTLYNYAMDTAVEKDINNELSPAMLEILNIMINHGGILYKAKHSPIWFYDLNAWNSLIDDYKRKVDWAEYYNFEFFIRNIDVCKNIESNNDFHIPNSFWYTSYITSQLKALANRKIVSLNLSEGICKLTNREYLKESSINQPQDIKH